jgi:hypothetical protein
MAAAAHHVSVGFQGGQVVAVRVSDDALQALFSALGSAGWHELATEDGRIRLNIGDVVYVRIEDEEHRVGFGA